ncbi:MAG: glycosyltransferase [Planctomycetota bacterium]
MASSWSCLHFLDLARLEQGGVVKAVLDLCGLLAEHGHDVTLATCDAADVPAGWKTGGNRTPKVITIEKSGWSNRLGSVVLSRRGLRAFEDAAAAASVVHLHTPWLLANYQVAPRLRRAGKPYVVSPHGMLDDWSVRQRYAKKLVFLHAAGRRLFRHAAVVHCTAEGEREQAARWAPLGDRGVVQCLPLDSESSVPPPGPGPALKAFPQIDPERPKVLFLSRLHPKKGVEFLIDACALLRDEGAPVQLLIAGPGESAYVQELQQRAVDRGIADLAHFLGMVRGLEKLSLIELADAFALPTYQENFGLAITEVMAAGTPVVTTRGVDIWREIEQGGAAIADQSARSFADHLKPFITSDEEARSRGEQGRRFVEQWLDPTSVAAGYASLYRVAIERGVSRRA